MNYLSNFGKTLLSVFILALTSSAIAQETVSLFLINDSTSFKVQDVSIDDPILAEALDMPYDIGDVKIWKWIELTNTFEGYVRRNYIAKGIGIEPGAPIYFIPGDENAFLKIYEEIYKAEVIEAVDETWAKVSINTSIPVYFEVDAPVIEPVIEEPVVVEPDPIVEENYEAESNFANDHSGEPTDLGVDATPSSGPINRILEGKLVKYKPLVPNPFKKSPYQWQLVNKQKQRLAFVDPSNLILSIPFKTYRDRRVSINGSIYQVNKGKDILIVAHQISKL